MAGPRYVEVPTSKLFGELDEIGSLVGKAGGSYETGSQGREVYYDICPPHRPIRIRIYTSVGKGEETARECGEDAIRIVLGHVNGGGRFKPVRKSRKVLRTAPQNLEHGKRVEAFLTRLRGIIRASYKQARDIPPCPTCGSVMVERKSRSGPFWGCSRFPECRGTRPMKKKD